MATSCVCCDESDDAEQEDACWAEKKDRKAADGVVNNQVMVMMMTACWAGCGVASQHMPGPFSVFPLPSLVLW
jgi:hypothetical protein